MFQVESAYLSDVGLKRSRNEDFALAYEPDDPVVLQGSGSLYLVADGVSGRSPSAAWGELASQYACWNVLAGYYSNPQPNPSIRLKQSIRQVGNEIFRYAANHQATGAMATTLVALALHGDYCTIANVGDSRAYLIRNGAAEQITRDHTLAADIERGSAFSEEADLPQAAQHVLTRSLGGELEVFVDTFPDIPLRLGDRLLLCTDGLTRYVRPHELAQIASASPPAEAVTRLIELAKQRGGADNITALLVAINERVTPTPLLPGAPRRPLPKPVSWEALETSATAAAPRERGMLESTQPSATQTARSKPPLSPLQPPRQVFGRYTAPLVMVLAAVSCLALTILASAVLVPYLRQRGMFIAATATTSAVPTAAAPLGSTAPQQAGTALPLSPGSTITEALSLPLTPAAVLTTTLPLETPTPTADVITCILTVQEGDTLSTIVTRLNIALQPAAFACASGDNGGCAYDPAAPDVLGVGWRMVFPDVNRQTCLDSGGEPPAEGGTTSP